MEPQNKMTVNFDFKGHSVRIVEMNGKPWFVATDVCEALDIQDPSTAVKKLDQDEKGTTTVGTLGGTQKVLVISEAGLYQLIFVSRKPAAKEFKRWLAHDVLPALRRDGYYKMPGSDENRQLSLSMGVESLNSAVRALELFKPMMENAGVSSQIQLLTSQRLFQQVGVDLPITIPAENKLVDCTTIARRLGILSATGRPHKLAVGAIIKKLDISADEKVETYFDSGKHQGTTTQYVESVVEKVGDWIRDHGYPRSVTGHNGASLAIKYKQDEQRSLFDYCGE